MSSWKEPFIEEQFATIKDFLRTVHPFLEESEGSPICMEIRPLARDGYDYRLSRSLNLWNLNDASLLRLFQFLVDHVDERYCMYYSIYTFDYGKDAKTKRGSPTKKGLISEDNAIFTQEIVFDFDNVQEKDMKQIYQRFEKAGLKGLLIHTGHGFQLHFLLKEKVFEKDLLKRSVDILLQKGYPCDPTCVDTARIMRLPFTKNYKCFKEKKYASEKENPPLSTIRIHSTDRYDVDTFFQKLEIVAIYDDTITKKEKVPQKKKEAIKSVSSKEDSIALKKISYPIIEQYTIPEAIKKMLNFTKEGFRNQSLGFLVHYFKKYLRLGKNEIEEILTIWANHACVPAYDAYDFKTDFSRFYFKNGLLYNKALAKEFGFIDFEEISNIQKHSIHISNAILKQLDVIHGNEIRAYLGLKLLEHLDKEVTIDSLAKVLKLTTRALRPALQSLIKQNIIYVMKGNRRLKEPNTYHSTKITNYSEGYFQASFNDIKSYLDELGIGELKLYLFMSYKFFYGDCFMSQENIGKHIGVKQNSVSTITKSLEDKMFIRIIKTPMFETKTGEIIYSCTYTLLR